MDEAYLGSSVLRQFGKFVFTSSSIIILIFIIRIDDKRLVRQISYNFNRTSPPREYLVLEVKTQIPADASAKEKLQLPTGLFNSPTFGNINEGYVIVCRSVAGVRDGGDIKELKSHSSESTFNNDVALSSSPTVTDPSRTIVVKFANSSMKVLIRRHAL